MAAFGVDVLDPAVSTRRVAVLLERIPPAARRPGEAWSVEAELLAVLVDQVASLTYVTLRAAGAKNVAKPRPIPRPSSPAAARKGPQRPAQGPPEASQPVRAGSWADAARMLAALPGMSVRRGE
jgi:hypothetical protein